MLIRKQPFLLILFTILILGGIATAVITLNNHLAPYSHLSPLRRPVYTSLITDTDTWISYSHASFRAPEPPTAVLHWFQQVGWQMQENNASRTVTFFDVLQIRRQVVVLTGPSQSALVGVHTAVTVDLGLPLFETP